MVLAVKKYLKIKCC